MVRGCKKVIDTQAGAEPDYIALTSAVEWMPL
jgi:hypothetical protein